MRSNIILLLVTITLLLLLACNKDEGSSNNQSFRSNAQENELNHLKLDFTASNFISVSSQTISFTSDTIIVQLQVDGLEGKGTGEVHLYRGDSTKITAYNFTRDILITDTLINMSPDKATITFWKFTGRFVFQMDGK